MIEEIKETKEKVKKNHPAGDQSKAEKTEEIIEKTRPKKTGEEVMVKKKTEDNQPKAGKEETKVEVKKEEKIEAKEVKPEKEEKPKEEKKSGKKMDDKKMTFRTVTQSRPKVERREERVKEFEEKVLEIARVARVVKGGRRFKFRAAVVVGNKNGKIGVGVGKGSEVRDAVRKAVVQAKKVMVTIKRNDTTIPTDVENAFKGARVMLKPAPRGAGIIAGGAVRVVVDAAGISNISSKMLGSQSKINNMFATFHALKRLTKLEDKNEVRFKR